MSSEKERKKGSGGRGGGAAAASGGGHGVGMGARGGRGNSRTHRTPHGQGVKAEELLGVSGALGQQPVASDLAGVAHSSLATPTKELQMEEDRSSSASSDAHSSVSQRTSESLRSAVAALEQRERQVALLEKQLQEQQQQQQQLQGSSAVQASVAIPHQQPQQQQPLEEESTKLPAVRPPELTYTGASAGTALEDWLFKLGQLFSQTRSCRSDADWQARERVAQLYWDRDMSIWWSGQQRVAAAAGAPIQSWSAFVAALRRQFVSIGDSHLARANLLALRMKANESMEAYVQRAAHVVARAGALIDDRMAAVLLLSGMDKARFPLTFAAISRKERAAVGGISFAQMRAELTLEAALEPRPSGYGGGSSTSGGGGGGNNSGNNGAKGATSSRQHRINALRQQADALEQAEEEDGASNSYSTAPLSSTDSDRCNKCGGEGHIAPDCKSKKELRTCFHCRQPGHLKTRCPKRKAAASGRGEGEAARGASAAAASSKSAPKNE